MSTVPRPGRKPHWVSGRTFSASFDSRLSKILTNTLPGMERSDMPR